MEKLVPSVWLSEKQVSASLTAAPMISVPPCIIVAYLRTRMLCLNARFVGICHARLRLHGRLRPGVHRSLSGREYFVLSPDTMATLHATKNEMAAHSSLLVFVPTSFDGLHGILAPMQFFFAAP